MADKQKIEGVPEGWRLIGLRNGVQYPGYFIDENGQPQQWPSDRRSISVYAVIERIPQPKRKVIVAELDLTGLGIAPPPSGTTIAMNWPGYRSHWTRSVSSWRIEERDV